MGAAMVLKHVGFFREVRERLRENVRGLPSIHDAVRDRAQPDEDRILSYLRAGTCLLACGGVMEDVLYPSDHVRTSPDYMTDGAWMWPGELAHYVAEYHVALPSEFVADMRENGWVVPALGHALQAKLTDEIVRGWRVEAEQAEPNASADGGRDPGSS